MRLKHKLTFLNILGKNSKDNKPIHHAICSCGKQYKGTYKQFRRFKCTNNEKLPDKEYYDRYVSSAKRRGIDFSLTLEQFNLVTMSACTYCGDLPSMTIRDCKFSGIDRVDNKLGYTISNVTACCSVCNKIKGSMSKQDFVNKIEKINEYYISCERMIMKVRSEKETL